MDLITYALAKKIASSGGASGDPGILTQLQNSVAEVEKKVEFILPLATGAITTIKIGNETLTPTNNVLNLPLASGEVVGLVKGTSADSENAINKISVNTDGTMEVISLSSDKLVAGEETLIFNGNYENYFNETKGEKL